MIDPQVQLGIKELWSVAWVAAYLKNRLPDFVDSWTHRQEVPPGRDRWEIPILTPESELANWKAIETGIIPPSSPSSTIIIRLESFRLAIELGSLMDGVYSIGLGPVVITQGFSIVYYWVVKEPYVV